jgi:DtxR family transcriptional regulator, Mn-dependent transcriptional regulator
MRRHARAACLEAVLELTRGGEPARTGDVAEAMGLHLSRAEKMVRTLRDEGLAIDSPGEGTVLTEIGRGIALKEERRHRLLEAFLLEVLGMDARRAHEEACAVERQIPEEAADQICAYLEHPRHCPGDCAGPAGATAHAHADALRPLSDLKEAEIGRIRVVIAERGMRHDLMSLGFLPNVEVRVRKKLRSHSLLVRVKGTEIAIGWNVARGILVAPAGLP